MTNTGDRDSGLRAIAGATAAVALLAAAGAGALALEARNASANPSVQPAGQPTSGTSEQDTGTTGDDQALQPPAFDPNAVPQDQTGQPWMQPPVTSGS